MKFKPEDFLIIGVDPKEVADKANNILQSHIATLPRVYGWKSTMNKWSWSDVNLPILDSHTALLWGIEPLATKKSFKDIAASISEQLNKPLTQEQVDKINSILEADVKAEKKECEHEPEIYGYLATQNVRCKHCGIWLEHAPVKWKPVEEKKECEHKNIKDIFPEQQYPVNTFFTNCPDCGVELKARWEKV